MLDRLVRHEFGRAAEPADHETARPVPRPVRRCLEMFAAAVRPTLGRPESFVVVPAGEDEAHKVRVRDREHVDPERGHFRDMRGTFVVQGPWIGGRAPDERPAVDENVRRCGCFAAGVDARQIA